MDAVSAVPGVTDTADPFAAPADAMALATQLDRDRERLSALGRRVDDLARIA